MIPVSWDSLQRNTIVYSIAASSEYSGRYAAENIRFDRPLDVQSRWSGTRENGLQWVLLELATVGVLGGFQMHWLVGMRLIHLH